MLAGQQLPYGAARSWGEGLVTPPPLSQILPAWCRYMDRSSSQGPGIDFPSSALTQLRRKGSAPGSLLNYSWFTGEGELSGSGCCFLQLPKSVYTHPTISTGDMWVCPSANVQ